jgi:abequosyltransferase
MEISQSGLSLQNPKLSICIATYNRAEFIIETLDTILPQMRFGVELVVVDGASPDRTREVLTAYCANHPEVRYIREIANSGVDADYDKAVGYARGEYCFLMTDDDLIVPGAIDIVWPVLDQGIDLVVVDAEVDNSDFSGVLQPRMLKFDEDRSYGAADNEQFFLDAAFRLTFIGGIVIRRRLWLERNRERYFGSLFVHVGVIFQTPIPNIRIIAAPLIRIRYGNAMWTSRGFEIWMFKWPRLVWSFDVFSDAAKARVSPREPYRNIKSLVWSRSIGAYSIVEYRQHLHDAGQPFSLIVAMLPATWLNAFSSLYCALFSRDSASGLYDLVRSKNSTWVTRKIARMIGV